MTTRIVARGLAVVALAWVGVTAAIAVALDLATPAALSLVLAGPALAAVAAWAWLARRRHRAVVRELGQVRARVDALGEQVESVRGQLATTAAGVDEALDRLKLTALALGKLSEDLHRGIDRSGSGRPSR
jgi:hypothetical protein